MEMQEAVREAIITAEQREMLRRFREDVEHAFPGRVKRVVLFGSRARGDAEPDSDWDVAVFIDGYDRLRERLDLAEIAARHQTGKLPLSHIAIPSNREHTSTMLLRNIDAEGIDI